MRIATSARAIADRLRGIDQQVHDHLMDLGAVDFDETGVAAEFELNADVAREGSAQEREIFLNQRVQVNNFDHEAALAGIRQHLLGKLRGAFGGQHDVVGDGTIALRRGFGEKARVAQNADEQIIEIVRDAAGHDAEALQARAVEQLRLPLALLFFGPFAFRDVAGGTGDGLHLGRSAASTGTKMYS